MFPFINTQVSCNKSPGCVRYKYCIICSDCSHSHTVILLQIRKHCSWSSSPGKFIKITPMSLLEHFEMFYLLLHFFYLNLAKLNYRKLRIMQPDYFHSILLTFWQLVTHCYINTPQRNINNKNIQENVFFIKNMTSSLNVWKASIWKSRNFLRNIHPCSGVLLFFKMNVCEIFLLLLLTCTLTR